MKRFSRFLYAHPGGRLGLLLGPAVLWLLVFYLVALALLLLTSLWQQDVFTAELVHKWTLDNYDKLFTGQGGLWLRIFGRTVLLATIVTLIDVGARVPAGLVHGARGPAALAHAPVPGRGGAAVVEHPRADLRLAHDPRRQRRAELAADRLGHARQALERVPLQRATPIAITWVYVWLPFMVLPLYTALEKIPSSYLEASRDLGAGAVDHVPPRDLPARASRAGGRLDRSSSR